MTTVPSPGDAAIEHKVFQALADPLRRRLIQLMLKHELSVSELVAILKHPQSTISRHLKVLRNAGLVFARRDGVMAFYRCKDQDGDAAAIQARVLDWLQDRPLGKAVEDRVQKVLRRRHDETVALFDRLAKQWDELRDAAFGEAFAFEAFIDLLPAEWTVADVGAGTGFLLPSLAAHFAKVIAVDASAAMLECARQRLGEMDGSQVAFHVGEFERLPLSDGECDLATACLVLHHVGRPPQALTEMHRVLKPGGRLLVVEQEKHDLAQFHEVMQDRWWGFEPAELSEMLTSVGFEGVQWRPLTTIRSDSGAVEGPGLFVMTAHRGRTSELDDRTQS